VWILRTQIARDHRTRSGGLSNGTGKLTRKSGTQRAYCKYRRIRRPQTLIGEDPSTVVPAHRRRQESGIGFNANEWKHPGARQL
jgi:hypothetical protein